MSQSIEHNIAKVLQLIRKAEKKYHRSPKSVQLIAVSKTRTAECIREVVKAGIIDIGENYLQEALEKQADLQDLDITWHFIGPIQSNKTRLIAENFDWVHSVDRLKIARRLNDQRPSHLPALNICLQVNVSREETKSGVKPENLLSLVDEVNQLPNITLKGLMAIPKATKDIQQQHSVFAQVHQYSTMLQKQYKTMGELSMGMSSDMQAAIAEGATMVRIGTDIFGPRK